MKIRSRSLLLLTALLLFAAAAVRTSRQLRLINIPYVALAIHEPTESVGRAVVTAAEARLLERSAFWFAPLVNRDEVRFEWPAQTDPGDQASAVSNSVQPSRFFTLRLLGTVGGPPWRAIIVGFHGSDGVRVLAPGDTVSGSTILEIAADSVVLTDGDSVVVLHRRVTGEGVR